MNNPKEVSDRAATIDTEIKKFASDLPFWKKRIAKDILSGKEFTDEDLEYYYKEMLQDNGVLPPSPIPKPPIEIEYNEEQSSGHDLELKFKCLEKVQGVNALKENQVIEFSDNLTILYGVNGSGKSGYTRLFKQAFYSKAPEEILPNIHTENPPKPVSACFTFSGKNGKISSKFPANPAVKEFEQFSVFDGKGIIKQLVDKNEFEFKPAGLQFFSKLTKILVRLESRLKTEIGNKKIGLDFSLLFSEESLIQKKIQNLSADSDLEELQTLSIYTQENEVEKNKFEKLYEDLLLKSRRKTSELKELNDLKGLITFNKKRVLELNNFFGSQNLEKIKDFIRSITKTKINFMTKALKGLKRIRLNQSEAKNGRIFYSPLQKLLGSNIKNTYTL